MTRLTPIPPSRMKGGSADGERHGDGNAIADELRSHAGRMRALGYSSVADSLDEWVVLLVDHRGAGSPAPCAGGAQPE